MATNKKSVKIQDVINKVDSVWGEEHEEKRRYIVRYYILLYPLRAFFAFSLIYFAELLIYLPILTSLPDDQQEAQKKIQEIPMWIIELTFNFPYYIFDLRSGIILSIASILLSLYVSVGKFADGREGLAVDARRAAYRGFAKYVGYIISAAFTLNFWYGLFAGYFQGKSRAPEIFGGLAGAPEWGKLIVPSDINLARYGDMPLWVLLFFAWFTLSSALMLTYDEKDILVKNTGYIRSIKNIEDSAKSLESNPYEMVVNYINFVGTAPKLAYKSKRRKFRSNYHDLFVRDYGDSFSDGNVGFKFVQGPKYLGPALWIVFFIAFTFATSIIFRHFYDLRLGYIAISATIVIFSVEILSAVSVSSYFYSGIHRLNIRHMDRWRSKMWIRVKISFPGFILGFLRVLLLLLLFCSIVFPPGDLEQFDNWEYLWKIEVVAPYWLSIIAFYLIKYLCIRPLLKYLFMKSLKKESLQFFNSLSEHGCKNIRKKYKINEYLLIAYIYCSILRINEYYLDYKSEIGKSEKVDSSDRAVRYQGSRPTSRRIPKALRRK